jgi:hypothetical protein
MLAVDVELVRVEVKRSPWRDRLLLTFRSRGGDEIVAPAERVTRLAAEGPRQEYLLFGAMLLILDAARFRAAMLAAAETPRARAASPGARRYGGR